MLFTERLAAKRRGLRLCPKSAKRQSRLHGLRFESLEARQLLAATQIVTSADGSVVIGADFTSTEVRSKGWDEPYTEITIETTLPTVDGYARTETATGALSGTAPTETGSIVVAGQLADWSSATGQWSLGGLDFNPGINRVYVQTFAEPNGGGRETDRHYIDIWYDTGDTSAPEVTVPFGSIWEYKDDGSNQGTAWRTDDPAPAWPTGPAQLGYGDGDEQTVVASGPDGDIFVTTYFRHKFNIPAGTAAQLDQIVIDLVYDDGGAVYINGTEVVRTSNLPGTLGDNSVQYDTWADADNQGTRENRLETYIVPANLTAGLLRDGENILAVEIHQNDVDSSDISFDLAMRATQAGASGITQVSGTLPAGTTTWRAEDGPYLIVSDVTVPSDATLVVEPGTTVYFEGGQRLLVEGRLDAQGSRDAMIRFSRTPGATGVSRGIQFDGTMQDNRITYAVLEYAGGTNDGLIGLDDSNLLLDHVTLDHADRRRIRSQDSSLIVRNSVFTDIFGPDEAPTTDNFSEHIWGGHPPVDGHFIVENNIFGTTKGHNDAIDFDAGERPDAIPQILNNTFLGGGDDAMDFEGDVHIEGNLVTNFIKDRWNTGSGNSNGISAGIGRHYFMTRNIFMNVQHVAQVKQASFMTFVNNTVVGASVSGLYFQRPTGGEFGRGAYVVGNVFVDTPVLFDEMIDETDLTVNYSAVTTNTLSLGSHNIDSDPQLIDPDNFNFNLAPDSPARGAGFNGSDMGALVRPGATIAGEPIGSTMDDHATLTVGGADIFAYRYRLNLQPWSAPVPVTSPGTKDAVIPPIELTNLAAGWNSVLVQVQNSAGVWQPLDQATRSRSWRVVPVAAPALQLTTRDTYLGGAGLLVRVDVTGEDGNPIHDLWDGVATLSSDNPNVTLSNNQVKLVNGRGSLLVGVSGNEPFTLTAAIDGLTDSRQLTSLADTPQNTVSGTLTGDATAWSGVVHVTGDVTVPVGHTLTINPGTLVLLDGTAGALDENGTRIQVLGAIRSLGTPSAPVTFTATDMARPWGEIDHDGASEATYAYTHITRAGHASRGGHTNTGPAIRSDNSTLSLDHVSITDIAGKIMEVDDSELVFSNTLFSRAVMGPEINDTGLLMVDSHVIDMLGIYHEGGVTDDNDGIYMHRQAEGQEIRITNSVFAFVDDDAVDTLGADIVLEYSIVRNANNPNTGAKGISMIEGTNLIHHTLFVDNTLAVNLKAQDPSPHAGTTLLNHVTIVGSDTGLAIEDKFDIDDVQLQLIVNNSIIHADELVTTDYDPADVIITYSNLSAPWPGFGNTTANPLFVDPTTGNYQLAPGSPAIDAGDPATTLDADGSRADQGALPAIRAFLPGDLDLNGVVDDGDIDRLCLALHEQQPDPFFDLNGDGNVNQPDVDYLLEEILNTHRGDANLDGQIDGTDLAAWQANRFSATVGWANGDFNCDGAVDGRDFHAWLLHRFTAPPQPASGASGRTPQAPLAGASAATPPLPISGTPSPTGPSRDASPPISFHEMRARDNRPSRLGVAGEPPSDGFRSLSIPAARPRRALPLNGHTTSSQALGGLEVHPKANAHVTDKLFAELDGKLEDTPSSDA